MTVKASPAKVFYRPISSYSDTDAVNRASRDLLEAIIKRKNYNWKKGFH